MNVEEFLSPNEQNNPEPEKTVQDDVAELDVQKAVVEELAEEKANLEIELSELRSTLAIKNGEVSAQKAMMSSLNEKVASLKARVAELEEKLAKKIEADFDAQSRSPNALALIDRNVELPDRFAGETRDHVLEVLSEARVEAEKNGRLRRAQILESVLVSNEPCGQLKKNRSKLEKLFADNANVINGQVIDMLKNWGISHKEGEKYLLTTEIINRNF